MVKVRIDRDECISCGACWSSCPDVFAENDDDGLTMVATDYQVDGEPGEGSIPDDLEDCANDGADSCPVECIHVG
ncbi:MAG: ferredoxin [Anaerolineae bacterium]|nr:ferredoxin [Chloroflexota bacterium]